jgi:3-dehydro-4-phosphotetronate decarboxylase
VTENEAREEICRVGQSLFARGYVHASAGNISVRLDAQAGGGYLITPTDACLGFLEPARLARLDAQGNQLSGDRASKTIVLHRRIYGASAQTPMAAGCIIHTHSTHCVALTLQPIAMPGPSERELLPPLTPYFVMKVGHVPVIDYRRPGDNKAADHVAIVIEQYGARGVPIRAVMLERLGPTVWHDTPAAAMATLEELEETAKLWHLTRGQAVPLGDAQIDELRKTFGACW